MNQSVIKTYPAPPLNLKAVLRYAADAEITAETEELYKSCLEECLHKTVYKVCYRVVNISTEGLGISIGGIKTTSKDLKLRLEGCDSAIVFAATAGLDYDRLIAKYGRTDPAKAYVVSAIGTERVEALCDAFCADVATANAVTKRFSPGYGDLPLELQKDIFNLLNPKDIGVYLNGSLLMTPSKSVTAIMGIKSNR